MNVGLRRKHWVLASLSLTAFLLLLVYSTTPLHSHTPSPVPGEMGFLHRHISNENTGYDPLPRDPQNSHPLPPGPPGIHLTRTQKEELKKQGVLIFDTPEGEKENGGRKQEEKENEWREIKENGEIRRKNEEKMGNQRENKEQGKQRTKEEERNNEQQIQNEQQRTEQQKQTQSQKHEQIKQKNPQTRPQGENTHINSNTQNSKTANSENLDVRNSKTKITHSKMDNKNSKTGVDILEGPKIVEGYDFQQSNVGQKNSGNFWRENTENGNLGGGETNFWRENTENGNLGGGGVEANQNIGGIGIKISGQGGSGVDERNMEIELGGMNVEIVEGDRNMETGGNIGGVSANPKIAQSGVLNVEVDDGNIEQGGSSENGMMESEKLDDKTEIGVGGASGTESKPSTQQGGSEVEVHEGGNLSPHAQWLKNLEAQHKDFLKTRGNFKLRGRHKGAVLSGAGGLGGYSAWRDTHGRITFEGLKKKLLEGLRRFLTQEFRGVEEDFEFRPGQEVKTGEGRNILVLSTWRSGSTYLGDLLNAYPGTYYSFEPLHYMLKNHHLEDGPLVEVAQQVLNSLLTCDYSGLDEYLNYARNYTFLLSHNTRLWNSCTRNRAFCFDKDFLNRACKLLPVKVLKTVRMGLSPVVSLLQNPDLDLRVLHLVRDPRGCLHSRLKLNWCHADVCRDPGTVCSNLLRDLTLSDWVKDNFPNRYLMVRYEDLGLNPEQAARKIYDFLQLSYNKHVSNFVQEHTQLRDTKKKKKDAYGTYRDSKATIFAWRGALNYETVSDIQSHCAAPIQRLNLRMFESEEEYRNMSIPVLMDER